MEGTNEHPILWENIFQAIGHPTMILDKDHRILEVNDATVKAVEKPKEELIGKYCYEVFHSSTEPACGCPLKSLTDSGKLETNDMLIEALGGMFLVSCTPILDDNGQIERVIHIATDVTARYRAEEEVEAILDIMAHDLRNRLQATLLGAEILRDICRNKTSEAAVAVILDSISSLSTIIEKVHSTKGFLNMPLEDVYLEDTLMHAVKILRFRFPDVQVNLRIEIQNALIKADPFLENLFLNILENAIIHNHSIKKVVWIHATPNDDLYTVHIIDNGSGIPAHVIGSLFDTSRRFGGIGIAQSIRIVKKYGGVIKFKPKLGETEMSGAKFTIILPKPGKVIPNSAS